MILYKGDYQISSGLGSFTRYLIYKRKWSRPQVFEVTMNVTSPEITMIICKLLRPKDLSSLARCSRFHNIISEAVLYSNVDVVIRPTGLRYGAKQLLNLLVHDHKKCRLIRSLRVRESVSYTRSQEETSLLRILISIILRKSSVQRFSWVVTEDMPRHVFHSFPAPAQSQSLSNLSLPSTLTSLTFSGSVVDWNVQFPNLRSLDCGRVQSAQQLSWISRHICDCKLTRLRVAMRPIARHIYSDVENKLSSMLQLVTTSRSLRTLTLEAVNSSPYL